MPELKYSYQLKVGFHYLRATISHDLWIQERTLCVGCFQNLHKSQELSAPEFSFVKQMMLRFDCSLNLHWLQTNWLVYMLTSKETCHSLTLLNAFSNILWYTWHTSPDSQINEFFIVLISVQLSWMKAQHVVNFPERNNWNNWTAKSRVPGFHCWSWKWEQRVVSTLILFLLKDSCFSEKANVDSGSSSSFSLIKLCTVDFTLHSISFGWKVTN